MKPYRRGEVREGTEESAKPLCISCVIKQQMAQRGQARSDMLSDAPNVFFFPFASWIRSPPPLPLPVRSSLSSLIPSNLTTLHGWIIINQVTNRATPLCFRGTALLSSLRGSNVSHLFQALAVRITQGCYNSGLFALWKRLIWCVLPSLPERKQRFYFLRT